MVHNQHSSALNGNQKDTIKTGMGELQRLPFKTQRQCNKYT